jgi:DNA replication protein DnaC
MVELSDDEKEIALKEAMIKKHAVLEDQRRKRLADQKASDWRLPWNPKQLYEYAKMRANELIRFESGDNTKEFIPTANQKDAINALSLYFTNSELFETIDVKKYNTMDFPFSINKGLWMWGNPGVGKTLLMKMFSRNKRLCYRVVECPKIVQGYVKHGDDHINHYSRCIPDIKSYSNFFQDMVGVCYNDLGIETLQAKHYGTAINVMESILLDTYENKVPFFQRHVTTNLTFDQVKEKYGVRITDRIKQCFNVIEIKGESLRGSI